MIHQRRGTAYLLVVGVCALAAAVALTAVVLRGAQLEDTMEASNAGVARALAQAGLEAATSRIRGNPTWRAALDGDVVVPTTTVAGGTFAVRIEDPVDGNPRVGEFDPAILISTGQSGNARFVLRAPLHFRYEPHDAMRHSLYTRNRLRVDSSADVVANKPVRANSYSIHNSASMDVPTGTGGNLNDAKGGGGGGGGLIGGIVGGIVGGIESVLNALSPSSDPPHLPTNILPTYSAYGPTHTPASFGMGWFNFSSTVLSPGLGPLSARPNDKVIILDANGGNVTLNNVRVRGTLVIHNAATVTVSGRTRFEPLVDGWPALVIHGNLDINLSAGDLSEAALGVNLNPPGAPYFGVANDTLTDTYPQGFGGFLYTTGRIDLRGTVHVDAPILAHGEIRVHSNNILRVDVPDELVEFPPPGFRVDTIIAVERNAVARVVD